MPSAKASRLFEQALDVAEDQRPEFLRASEPDESVRKEVERLLRAHAAAGQGFMKTNALDAERARHMGAPPPLLESGSVVGSFVVIRELGSGGFGTVYLASDKVLGREVALKVTRDIGEEGRMMAPLTHENIVRVYSETTLPDRDLRLLCMPYVLGTNLEKILAADEEAPIDGPTYLKRIAEASGHAVAAPPMLAGASPVDLGLWIGVQLAEALAHAHQQGVLHLDLKGDNVLVGLNGRPQLTDFNVAQRSLGEASTNRRGGTRHYMPPEQEAMFRGEHVVLDARADVFALGTLLGDWFDRLPDLPRELETLLARCTAADRELRPHSAGVVAAELRRIDEVQRLERLVLPSATTEFPRLTTAMLGAVPLFVGGITTAFFLANVSPPRGGGASPLFFWRALTGLVTFTGVWCLLVAAIGATPPTVRRLGVLLLPLLFFAGASAVAWIYVPAYLRAEIQRGFTYPGTVLLTFLKFMTAASLLAIQLAFVAMQFFCIRMWFPRLWSGETDAANRARKSVVRTLRVSLALQFVFVAAPLAVALAILSPGLSHLTLPKPMAILSLIGAAVTGVGVLAAAFLWTHLVRVFR